MDSNLCWAVYLETQGAEGSSREMVGAYPSEGKARKAAQMWEFELANFPDAHLPHGQTRATVARLTFPRSERRLAPVSLSGDPG